MDGVNNGQWTIWDQSLLSIIGEVVRLKIH